MGNETSSESGNTEEADVKKNETNTVSQGSRPPPATEVSAGSFGRNSSPRNRVQGRKDSCSVLITDGKYGTLSLR